MDINQVLNENPAKMARVGQEAEDARLKWQTEKEIYDREEAKMSLQFKAKNERKTATDIKCMVMNNDRLFNERKKLLVLEATYRFKLKDMEALEQELNSAKILSRIKMSELSNIEFGLKGGNNV